MGDNDIYTQSLFLNTIRWCAERGVNIQYISVPRVLSSFAFGVIITLDFYWKIRCNFPVGLVYNAVDEGTILVKWSPSSALSDVSP